MIAPGGPRDIPWKSENEGAQLSPTLSDPMDCSPPGSSVHGIFQARVLEWGAITFQYIISWKNIHLVGKVSQIFSRK